ncbi:MAG: iron deficiency-induced protein A [Dehalococcoidia bacterium]|nr:MAG: iron deficiency-induced protein A [Dehalococcoidia bacterium]
MALIRLALVAVLLGLLALPQGAAAQQPERVLNLYTGRHYDTDQRLYDLYSAFTGVKIYVIQGDADQLIQRMVSEGRNSPADVLITVDAGRLWRAEQLGLCQPVVSDYLASRIPDHLRHPDGYWYGFTKRARVIVYAKDRVSPSELSTYEDLADPKWRGRLLVRSSSNVYNLSLTGSLIAAHGEPFVEEWARGIARNLARTPQGGDTDQLLAVAAGQGDVAISNTYYVARLLASSNPEDRAVAEKLGVFFPNQNDRGTHVNISGGCVASNAPHRAEAIEFLEFLASDGAQAIFALGNHEYPVVAGQALSPIIEQWGPFREDTISAAVFGANNPRALLLMNRAGWR